MSEKQENPSRRSMLRRAAGLFGMIGATALAAGCGPRAETPPPPPPPTAPPPPPPAPPEPVPPPPAAPPARQSKKEAHYQSHPHGRERCGGCAHFVAPRGCEIVEGRISPRGWCRNFEAKA